MNQLEDQLIWTYIENKCTIEEKNLIEGLLAENPSLNEDVQLRKALHIHLQESPLDEPSFNFASKVMDALPEPNYIVRHEPIVSPIYSRIFIGGIALLTISIIGLALNSKSTSNPVWVNYITDANKKVLEVFSFVPPYVAQLVVFITISSILLFALDQIIKKRFKVSPQ